MIGTHTGKHPPAPGAEAGHPAPTPNRLEHLPILRAADPAMLAGMAHRAKWRAYEPGEVVLDFNEPTTEVCIVVEGAIRIQLRTPAGRELILNEVTAGGVFGVIAAIDGAPRTANATTLVRSRLCILPASHFLALACSTPAASLELLRVMAGMLRATTARLLEREALPVRLRLGAELLRLSHPRHDAPGRIVSPPPQQHILASWVSARREVVSRELSELTRQGLIVRMRGGILLPRPEALRAAINAELHGASRGETTDH